MPSKPMDGRGIPLLEKFRERLMAKGYSRWTIHTYFKCARRFLRACGACGREDLSWLGEDHIQAWLAEESRKAKSTHALSASALKTLLREFGSPLWTTIPSIRVPRQEVKILSDEAIIRLLQAAGKDRDRAMIYMAYITGMRIGEILGLRVGDLDLDGRLIHVRGIKREDDRCVPFDEVLQDLLRQYMASLPTRMPEEPLFATRSGGAISHKRAISLFRECALRAGLVKHGERGNVTWHKLRHTFGTKLVKESGLFVTQRLMGHKNPASTIRYLHPDLEYLRRIYDQAKPALRLSQLPVGG